MLRRTTRTPDRGLLVQAAAALPRSVRRYLAFETKTDAQVALFGVTAPEVYFIGVNKSGKTLCGTIFVLGCASGLWPPSVARPGRWRVPSRHAGDQPGRILVLAITNKQMLGASLGEFRRWCPPEWIYRYSARDEVYTLKRFDNRGVWHNEPGVEVWFRSVEQGREKIQGNEFDLVWIDEEPKERPFSELAVMLGPRNGHLIGTLTPVRSAEQGGATWLVDDVLNPALKGELDPAETQVIFTHRGDQVKADGTLYSEAELERAEAQYEEWEAAVRIRGEFMPAGGHAIFDRDHLVLVGRDICSPLLRGDVARGTFLARTDGPLAVWKHVEKGHEYVIPADCSGGDVGSTFAVAHVLDRETGEQVARYRARIDAAQYAFVLNDLSRIYNTALIGPEANPGGSGNVVIDRLLELRARVIRRPPPPGVLPRLTHALGGGTDRFGLWTSFETKEDLITGLREALRPRADGRASIILHDEVTLAELHAFQRDEKHRARAPKGRFDDCVISLGWGVWMIRNTPGSRPRVEGWKPPSNGTSLDAVAHGLEERASRKVRRLTTDRFAD